MLLDFLEKAIDAYFALIPRHRPTLQQAEAVLLIAHRGAHDHKLGILENTMDAFRSAEQAGCWGIELDVHVTADQVLVVNHDPTLNRLWGHDAAIADLTLAELRTLAPKIPTLAEVVGEFGHKMHLFIELKHPFKNEEVLVQELQGLTAGDDYHLLSLDAAIFESLSQFPKHSLFLVPVFDNVSKFCDLSIEKHYGGVLGNYLLMRNKLLNQIKAAKQVVGVGFVDSKYSLYREINRGIKYIFTNKVTKVNHYLKLLLNQ